MKKFLFLIVSVFIFLPNLSAGKIVAGPWQGSTTANSIKIWVLTKNTQSVTLELKDELNQKVASLTISTDTLEAYKKYNPLIFSFENIPSGKYIGEVYLDGKNSGINQSFTTLSYTPEDTIRFFVLSCALSLPVGLKFLHPGIENRVYKHIAKEGADFTTWIGDYFYYLKWHTKSKEGLYKRNVWTRKRAKLNRFHKAFPNYSIWDDHDYGPNNSDSSFPLKNESLEVFKKFWPNPYSGTSKTPGCYFHFNQGDIEFFMTDNRFYRTEPNVPEASYFGKEQLNWLKTQLKESEATFKFIATGSQVLNKIHDREKLREFTEEYNDLLSFIDSQKITGVIFLSGDRHHSELIRSEGEISYPLYDFTSSGVTSFRNKARKSIEAENLGRISGLLADYQNFGKITISGTEGNRECLIEVFKKRGKPGWSFTIKASELEF